MVQWFKNKRVYTQLALIILATVFFLFLIFGLAYRKANASMKAKNMEYINNLTRQLGQTVDGNYDAFTEILRLVAYNHTTQEFLLSSQEAERYTLHSAYERNASDFASLNEHIMDIVLVDARQRHYGLTNSSYPIPSLPLTESNALVSPLQELSSLATSTPYLVMGASVHSIDSYNRTNEKMGEVYLILSPSAFVGKATNTFDEGDTYIVLSDIFHQVLWGNHADYTTEHHKASIEQQNKLPFFTSVPLPEQNMFITVYQHSPLSLWNYVQGDIRFYALLSIPVLILLFLWILWARNLVTPMQKLSQFFVGMQKTALGQIDRTVALDGYEEIHIISAEINKMMQQIQHLTLETIQANTNTYETELLARQSELSHLRSQINPHFLYNTLETMVGIAYSQGQLEIAKIARSLSIMFKYSITGDNFVALENEMKIVKNYLAIQEARFHGRFETLYQMAPETMEHMVPKMILQPLIENTIVHGIETQERLCQLIIASYYEKDALIITVTDNGSGITAENLAKLQTLLYADKEGVGEQEHIGLRNVHHRIRLIYGDGYGLTLIPRQPSGLQVIVTLPREEL